MNNQLSWFKQFHFFASSSWFFSKKCWPIACWAITIRSVDHFPLHFKTELTINKSDYFRLAKQTESRFLTLPDYVRRSKCGEWRWKLCEEKTTSLKWDWVKEDITEKHRNRQWKLGNYFFVLALFFLKYGILCYVLQMHVGNFKFILH